MDVSRRILFFASLLTFCGIVWAAQQTPSARTPAPQTGATSTSQQNRGKISGIVTNGGSGQPLRKALVTLLPGNAGQGNNRGGQAPANLPGQPNPQQGQAAQAGRGQQGQAGQNPQDGSRGAAGAA